MTHDPSNIDELFMEVVDLPPDARTSWLDAHCPDPEVRRRVVELLGHYDRRTPDLDRPGVPESLDPELLLGLPDLSSLERVEEFEIVRLLGRGGMGVVYLARDTRLERLVALKLVPRLLLPITDGGLLREARAAARLDHPGIVRVHRIGVEERFGYIAMEYVEGPTLASRMSDHAGPFDPKVAVTIAIAVADALEHAHQRHIVHRDVKPGNILLEGGVRPRITDFGIARDLAEKARELTRHVAGTLAYMSPEQAQASTISINARSDVYSLGVVLYEMLAGEVPYRVETAADLVRRLEDGPPRRIGRLAPRVSRDLEVVVHTALARDPDDRYQTAGALAADLRSVAAGRPILARPPSLVRRARAWIAMRVTGTLAASLLLAVVLVAVLGGRALLTAHRGLARLTITTDASEAVAWLQPLGDDLRPGPPRRWSLPASARRIQPGSHVVTVVSDEGFAETTVHLASAADRRRIHVPLARPEGSDDGMVLVTGGDYVMGLPPAEQGREVTDVLLAPATVRLPPFLIDATEVSNADYRAHVEATGVEPPDQWPDPWPEGFGSLPVVGVTQDEAEAYARRLGKRLPSAREWAAAARGPNGRRFPWGDDPGRAPTPTPEMLRRHDGIRSADHAASYLAFAEPVDGRPELATPEGIRHLFGNVREYTRDRLHGRPVVRGGSWVTDPTFADLVPYVRPPADSTSWTRGFRCVRPIQSPFQPAGSTP